MNFKIACRMGVLAALVFAMPAVAARPANGPTGNSHFDDYRRAEIERLEAERRRLDDEVREFGAFVEELKRAKDREEFDAYMRKRRSVSPTTEV